MQVKTLYNHDIKTGTGCHCSGFTLMELMVSMAIFAILALVATPHMHSLADVINKRNAELQVLHDIRYAQAKTVEQGCMGILTVNTAGTEYTFGCDYVPYSASSSPAWDRVLKTQSLPAGISLSLDSSIFFNSRGQVIDAYGTMTTHALTLKVGGVAFSTGTLRPTGFFEYS